MGRVRGCRGGERKETRKLVAGEGEAGTEGKGQGDGGRIGWGRKVELVLLVVWLKERTTHVHKNPSGCLRINQSSIFFSKPCHLPLQPRTCVRAYTMYLSN